jgi:hypothetical protein
MKIALAAALLMTEMSTTTAAWSRIADSQRCDYPLSARRISGHRKLNRQAKKRRKAK